MLDNLWKCSKLQIIKHIRCCYLIAEYWIVWINCIMFQFHIKYDTFWRSASMSISLSSWIKRDWSLKPQQLPDNDLNVDYLKNGNNWWESKEHDTENNTAYVVRIFFLVALFKTECLIGSLIYPEPLLFSLCGDILLDKDRALWQREREGVRKRNDRAMTREEKKNL